MTRVLKNDIINNLEGRNQEAGKKGKLLLHSCCGPCATAVVSRLIPEWEVSVYYYNPNITDPYEYRRRKEALVSFLDAYRQTTGIRVPLLEGPYRCRDFMEAVKGLENCREGGERCRRCFDLRLGETAAAAARGGYDAFDTTLSVSPHKNSASLMAAGRAAAESWGPLYLEGNYKKKDGFGQSLRLSRLYGLYRQDYCGCSFSRVRV